MEFTVVPDAIREEVRSRATGGVEPEDLKALRAGKTIFIGGSVEETDRRVNSLRATIDYHVSRGQESRRVRARAMIIDGVAGKVVWLEEPGA